MPHIFTKSRDFCRQLLRDASDFIYTPSCVKCGEVLPDWETDQRRDRQNGCGRKFCFACYETLSCAVAHACLRCGAPVGPYLNTANGCRHCRQDSFQFERVFALGTYEGLLRDCCSRAKQPFQEPLTAGLTELLWEAHQKELRELAIDVVLPVPHHWTERTTRSHFPPMTMSRVFARRLMVPETLHILSKSRRTPAQTSLTPARRRANLRHAFRVVGGARLDGLTILLVDDILTTGTTADRASRVLKEAGASRIFVAVLARGVGRSTGR